ncbi:Deleted in lung and esophageal cancer protein 1 [Lobulomyces angularis]|nr:Deleted in lung and esophageal cancer protein 1 [Lobulomyces angularis]
MEEVKNNLFIANSTKITKTFSLPILADLEIDLIQKKKKNASTISLTNNDKYHFCVEKIIETKDTTNSTPKRINSAKEYLELVSKATLTSKASTVSIFEMKNGFQDVFDNLKMNCSYFQAQHEKLLKSTTSITDLEKSNNNSLSKVKLSKVISVNDELKINSSNESILKDENGNETYFSKLLVDEVDSVKINNFFESLVQKYTKTKELIKGVDNSQDELLDTFNEEIKNLESSYIKKAEQLNAMEILLNTSINETKQKEELLDLQDFKVYGPFYKSTGLPPLFNPIEMDETLMYQLGFLTLPVDSDLTETLTENIRSKVIPGLNKIEDYKINRIKNGKQKKWKKEAFNDYKFEILETFFDKNSAKKEKKILQIKDSKEIKNLKEKVEYLQNPRFPVINSKEKITEKNVSASTSVVPIPAIISFTDYQPNKTYRQTLLLKNRISHSQRFHITTKIPEKGDSPYFQIKLLNSPFEQDGTIAPGMSCKYLILFTPDSYADFEHSLHVTSEMGDSYFIPVKAFRRGPILSLEKVLNCGPCRANWPIISIWDIKNVGGVGKFYIVDEDAEEDKFKVFKLPNFMSDNSQKKFSRTGKFEVFPYKFSLEKNENTQIVVKYNPTFNQYVNLQEDLSNLKLACDNNTFFDFILKGFSQSEKVKIEKIIINATDFEITDNEIFDKVLNFGNQNPYSTTTATIIIKNETLLKFDYKWNLFSYPGENIYCKKSSFVNNSETNVTCFEFFPSIGTFMPEGTETFTINFTPLKAKIYETVAEFQLTPGKQGLTLPADIPSEFKVDEMTANTSTLLRLRFKGQGLNPVVKVHPPIIIVPCTLHVGCTFTSEITLENNSVSVQSFEWFYEGIDDDLLDISFSYSDNLLIPTNPKKVKLILTGKYPGIVNGKLLCKISEKNDPLNFLSVTLNCSVNLKPTDLMFSKNFIDFGVIALGDTKSIIIPLENKSNVELKWNIEGFSAENFYKANKNENELELVKDIGSMLPDALIKNETCYIFVIPNHGVIKPNSKQLLEFTFIPTWYQIFQGVVGINIVPKKFNNDLEPVKVSAIALSAYVQTPNVKIDNCEYEQGETINCYMGIPQKFKISAINNKHLEARIIWRYEVIPDEEVDESFILETKDLSVTFLPSTSFVLGSRESKEFEVEIKCSKVGKLSCLRLICQVEGMTEHDGERTLDLKVNSDGLAVTIEVTDPSIIDSETDRFEFFSPSSFKNLTDHSLKINYGSDLPIFKIQKRILVIRNTSAITSEFQLFTDVFKTNEEEDFVLQQSTIENSRFTLLGNEKEFSVTSPLEKIGFNSDKGRKYITHITRKRQLTKRMNNLLQDGKGAGFLIKPSFGVLGPYEEVEVEIICFNNIPNSYEDILHCTMKNWMDILIPVSLTVVGSPLRIFGAQLLQKERLEKTSNQHNSILNENHAIKKMDFGNRLITTSKGHDESECNSNENKERECCFKKFFQIENQSPVAVHLDLYSFSYECTKDLTKKGMNGQQDLNEMGDEGVFSVFPNSLAVAAFQTVQVTVKFESERSGSFTGNIIGDLKFDEKENGNLSATKDAKIQLPVGLKNLVNNPVSILKVEGKAILPKIELLEDGDSSFGGNTTEKYKIQLQLDKNMNVTSLKNMYLINETEIACKFNLDFYPKDMFTAKFQYDIPKFEEPLQNYDNTVKEDKIVKDNTFFFVKSKEKIFFNLECRSKVGLDKLIKMKELGPKNEPTEVGFMSCKFLNGTVQEFKINF